VCSRSVARSRIHTVSQVSEFGIHQRQVVVALNYAAADRAEIRARVDANDQALAQAEHVAGERQRLLA
jgi:hypothetical protein